MADASRFGISRRALLKAAGAAAAATAAAADLAAADATATLPGSEAPVVAEAHDHEQGREPLESLTADEAALLTAIAARLIPADANGPGAVEAGAVAYIDRALAGGLAPSREAYRRGLAALERYARSSRGASFRELAPVDQDSLLIDVETGAATGSGAGFDGSSAAFFAMLRAHTWQGTFGDPYYGGNRGYVGWDLVGYPGVRTNVTADDQRLGVVPPPLRRSAYDTDMFTKATARLDTGGSRHGDPA
jgi:gluconate 2-dehydrogenase gamma chain